MLDQYTAFEMLTPNEKFKKYVERNVVQKFYRYAYNTTISKNE